MNVELIAGKYEVLAELGRGGMGRVYKVRHRGLDNVYALKVLREHLVEDDGLIARFQSEARIMAGLRHPNIVQVFDIDRDGDRHYFVMEYIEGRALSEVLAQRQAPLPLDQVLGIAAQIGRALAYTHARKPAVIHRDIKPSNIMIEEASGRVIVTDFGIAKLLDAERTQHTRSGVALGTPSYAAPEQLRADRALDERADIFSLGLVLYEMVTGRPFFAGMTPEQIIGQKLFDPKEWAPSFDPAVPESLRRIIMRASAKDRERRYASVQGLLDDLQRAAAPEAPSNTRLRWVVLGAGVLGVAMLAVWLGFNAPPRVRIERPLMQAEHPPVHVPKPAPPNQPPRLGAWTPQADELRLAEGAVVDFNVAATDPEATSDLRYRWALDGETVALAPAWRYQPDFDAGGTHTVRVEVSDDQGAVAARQWAVNVADSNRPPRLHSTEPAEQSLTSATGNAVFQVQASDPDSEDRLSFAWELDGRLQASAGNQLRLDGLADGTYSVAVTISDPAGASVRHNWQLAVGRPSATAPSLGVVPNRTSITLAACAQQTFEVTHADEYSDFHWLVDNQPQAERGRQLVYSPAVAGSHTVQVQALRGDKSATHAWQIKVTPAPVTEADIERWLAQYQNALRQQDATALRALGDLYSEQELDQLRQRQRYEVAIQDIRATARTDGVDLQFEQVDRWYDPKTYSMVVDYTPRSLVLMGQGCGRIGARRR